MPDVDIVTADGVADAYLARPPGATDRRPAVVLFMDGIGLRPRIVEMADRIAGKGYVVLAPNLFYRYRRAPIVDVMPDLREDGARAEFFDLIKPLIANLTPAEALRDVTSYLAYLDGHGDVADGPVATTGYCMGGALSLRSAATFGDRIAAAASFHGGNLATDAPDSPHRLMSGVRAELYFAHADHDPSMTPDQIRTLDSSVAQAGVTFRSELYAGAAHGFTMSDTSAYDEPATDRHWRELFALLGRALPVLDPAG